MRFRAPVLSASKGARRLRSVHGAKSVPGRGQEVLNSRAASVKISLRETVHRAYPYPPGVRGLASVATFNPLCAERLPRDRARRRATLVFVARVWPAGLGRPGRPAPSAATEPLVATPQSAPQGAPGVLPTRLRAKTSFPMRNTLRSPRTAPSFGKT
ncbi:hypothetical protein HJG60_011561 [Phyllostomus discolor]|uniref:Uncharacterized protein n=1 Tax=Phyllostomus discolor TaxID=89673 RepID=A0A833ZY98_9CHIR|nr:hypothetical protein HJG60_011561 [Phyllostomus discolor]